MSLLLKRCFRSAKSLKGMVNTGAAGGGTAATVNDEEYAASAAARCKAVDDAFLKMIIRLVLESNELPK